jgi:hypothetical protein
MSEKEQAVTNEQEYLVSTEEFVKTSDNNKMPSDFPSQQIDACDRFPVWSPMEHSGQQKTWRDLREM